MYGLKQAPRAWFDKLSQFLLHLSFICNKADSSLFIYRTTTVIILLLIYIDDIILTGNDSTFIQSLLQQLSRKFAIKDLGDLHYFLGIFVQYFPSRLFLSQVKYVKDLLGRAGMSISSPISTPMATKDKFKPGDNDLVDATIYRSLISALQYLTFTKPDINFAVNLVCQHFNQPTAAHLRAVK